MTVGIANSAQVSIFLADFANAEPTGKVNVIGAGWQVMTMAEAGSTAAHSLVVLISMAPTFGDVEIGTTLTLRDDEGSVVEVPGTNGELQPVHVSQRVKLKRPPLEGMPQPAKLWSQGKLVVSLPTGLPLKVDHEYEWIFEIDEVSEGRWFAPFFVVHPSRLPQRNQLTVKTDLVGGQQP